ncbi:MAG: 50S ribosomal protein L29 [Myxococcales bacterium]|nr:50S ribosomal protein L29 [Myxococcales bacterium]
MNANELREKSIEDLRELNDERRRELFDLRFKHYTGQLLDTASLKKTRREIARIETVLRELEVAQSAGA